MENSYEGRRRYSDMERRRHSDSPRRSRREGEPPKKSGGTPGGYFQKMLKQAFAAAVIAALIWGLKAIDVPEINDALAQVKSSITYNIDVSWLTSGNDGLIRDFFPMPESSESTNGSDMEVSDTPEDTENIDDTNPGSEVEDFEDNGVDEEVQTDGDEGNTEPESDSDGASTEETPQDDETL